MSSPRKKLKLIAAIIADEINSGHTNCMVTNLLVTQNNQRCILISSLVSLSEEKEKHIKIQNFYEYWIDKYIEYDFFRLFRMTRLNEKKLLNMTGSFYQDYLRGEEATEPEKILLMALWYLGKGDTIISISDRFGVAESTCHKVIHKMVALISNLRHKLIIWPKDEEECRTIIKGFFENGGYPGMSFCLFKLQVFIKAYLL